jgi:hypothetical protein
VVGGAFVARQLKRDHDQIDALEEELGEHGEQGAPLPTGPVPGHPVSPNAYSTETTPYGGMPGAYRTSLAQQGSADGDVPGGTAQQRSEASVTQPTPAVVTERAYGAYPAPTNDPAREAPSTAEVGAAAPTEPWVAPAPQAAPSSVAPQYAPAPQPASPAAVPQTQPAPAPNVAPQPPMGAQPAYPPARPPVAVAPNGVLSNAPPRTQQYAPPKPSPAIPQPATPQSPRSGGSDGSWYINGRPS